MAPPDPLLVAMRAGDLARLRALIAAGADPRSAGPEVGIAIESALDSGDAAWLRQQAAQLLDPPHPHLARATALAESLGSVELVTHGVNTRGTEVAWGLYVTAVARLEARPLAIGIGSRRATIVLVAGVDGHALAIAVMAKTLARVGTLRVGEVVTPLPSDYDADVMALPARWQLVEPVLALEHAVLAQPYGPRTMAQHRTREFLARTAGRVARLNAIGAPAALRESLHRDIQAAGTALLALGWSAVDDPLDDAVAAAIVR